MSSTSVYASVAAMDAWGHASLVYEGGTTLTLSYGPGNRRIRKVLTGPVSETVTYLGGVERLDVNGSLSIRLGWIAT